eukprot:Gb_17093 [translate_table: standard]
MDSTTPSSSFMGIFTLVVFTNVHNFPNILCTFSSCMYLLSSSSNSTSLLLRDSTCLFSTTLLSLATSLTIFLFALRLCGRLNGRHSTTFLYLFLLSLSELPYGRRLALFQSFPSSRVLSSSLYLVIYVLPQMFSTTASSLMCVTTSFSFLSLSLLPSFFYMASVSLLDTPLLLVLNGCPLSFLYFSSFYVCLKSSAPKFPLDALVGLHPLLGASNVGLSTYYPQKIDMRASLSLLSGRLSSLKLLHICCRPPSVNSPYPSCLLSTIYRVSIHHISTATSIPPKWWRCLYITGIITFTWVECNCEIVAKQFLTNRVPFTLLLYFSANFLATHAVSHATVEEIAKPKWASELNNVKTLYKEERLFDDVPIPPHSSPKPNTSIYVSLLQGCTNIKVLNQIHARLLQCGLDENAFFGTKLVNMYTAYGSLDNARLVFDRIYQHNFLLWNAIIRGYAVNGHCQETLTLYYQMQHEGFWPDNFTFPLALKACANLSALREGQEIHCHMILTGFNPNVFVWTALIRMYVKCESIEDARKVFDKTLKRDVVLWTAMIAGYAQHGHANEALSLFQQMQLDGMKPDSVTIVSVLQACALSGVLRQGKCIHDYVMRNGFELDVFVGTVLIDMYAKCGIIEIARRLFDRMSERNVVSWNAMIAGYAQNGLANEALSLFHQMQSIEVVPNSATMVSVLLACAHLGAPQQAYGMHGHGDEACALFYQMQQTGIKPDHITFISILSACSHAGLVDEGWKFFHCMTQDYCIMPRGKHYACMVDLLGRAGHLDEAQDFIKGMPIKPDAGVWGALLGACRIHCNIELGEHVAEHLFDLEPENVGVFVLLSNIYAAAGRWNDVAKVRTMIKDRGLKKTPGCSLIEVNNRVHAFLVGDRSHPQSERIYATLETLAWQMEEVGYVPTTNFVLHDVEDEVKEGMLYSHSEKLAIAFGLINTSLGTPIQITKNLRVCGECHNATKFISKFVRREIIVRDANRFHHFRDGLCSCGDYW